MYVNSLSFPAENSLRLRILYRYTFSRFNNFYFTNFFAFYINYRRRNIFLFPPLTSSTTFLPHHPVKMNNALDIINKLKFGFTNNILYTFI